jgi:hypothetical protein
MTVSPAQQCAVAAAGSLECHVDVFRRHLSESILRASGGMSEAQKRSLLRDISRRAHGLYLLISRSLGEHAARALAPALFGLNVSLACRDAAREVVRAWG